MPRIFLLTTAILTGLVMAETAAAFGGRMGPMERPAFEQLDADGDGKVTAAELEAYPAARAAERFAAADTNGDGALSPDELAASIDRMRSEAIMSRLDSDGDGTISQTEMEAAMGGGRASATPGERMLDRVDTDDDGAISAEEYNAFSERRMRHPASRAEGRRGWGDRHGDRPFRRN